MVNGIVQSPWRVTTAGRRAGMSPLRNRKDAASDREKKTTVPPDQRVVPHPEPPPDSGTGEHIDERV